jgi:integrase
MRARGTGCIYLRGRVWWLKYYDREGRARRESSRSESAAEAARLLRRRVGEVASGRHLLGCDVERTTFDDLRRFIFDDYALNARKSADSMRQSFRALAQRFEGRRAHEIDYSELQAYAAERMAEGRQPATVRRELVLLHRAFVLAERAGKATVPRFPTVRVENARSGFFEREQWAAVRAQLAPWLQDVGDFAYLTGWRVMEILALKWRQVDFAAGSLRLEIGMTKTGAGRLCPFAGAPGLRALLERRRAESERIARETARIVPWVFVDAKGSPVFSGKRPKKSLRRAWRAPCARAGVPGRLLHDFRRTAVRNLERAAVGRKVAMDLVGMKTDSIYRRYEIVTEADLAEGMRRLGAYLERK